MVMVRVMLQLIRVLSIGLTPVQELALVCVCPPHSIGQFAVSP